MASNKSMMPYDIVNQLLSDMVEVTSKHFEEHNSGLCDNEINCSPKQESSGNEINCDNKDLPVRRSSRIKHLTVQQDKVKKKIGSKQNRSIKNSESKPIEENHQSSPKEENIQIDVVSSKGSDEILNSKNEVLSDSNKDDKHEGAKSQKINKRSQRRGSAKSEKEDTKFEKSKTDKKKSTRKKKYNLTESVENSIDKVIDDVINASLNYEDSVTKSEILPIIITTPCSVVVDDLQNEIRVPEISNNSTKQSDNQNLDIKEKQSESNCLKPVKVKSRWWQSSKLEGVLNTETTDTVAESTTVAQQLPTLESTTPLLTSESKVDSSDQNSLILNENCIEVLDTVISTEKPDYEHIDENIYRFERKKSKSKKQVRRMVCDCTLTKEEIECGMLGCKEECLNRLLMIECGFRCPLGDACSNKRFQKKQYVKSEIIKTEKKGWGLRALEDISIGEFLMEFVGEVLNHKEYRQRVKLYAKEKNIHCYFMALKTDEILDATYKGNLTRFINHSCDPNCETQKWTVNGELRVGVFARRPISVGEEFTLDYKFQRYGREAQKCFCGSALCSGYIGGEKQISIDAYSGVRSNVSKRKKGSDDKKREWEDLALEEEIEKLNSVKGLRNREETLKFARLMVRAEESSARHQLLDIIIKTEEQACLRLFLDYHGLPLLWSWMTDTVELDLKIKILQVLALLPVSNKTMLLDSKVMNIVEKWVKEFAADKQEDSDIKELQSSLTSLSDENSEPVCKKLKNVEISDSETDSNGSNNTNENASESSILNENFKTEILKSEMSPSEPAADVKSPSDFQNSKIEPKEDDPQYELKKSILSKGVDLLNNWKNLKEVFRIPRLEQQKRKEDELEADHHMMSVCAKTEEKKPEVVEVTGDQIQVLISGKTPSFSDNIRTFEYDNPDMNYKMDDRSRNNLLQVPQNNNKMKKRPFISKPKMDDLTQRKLKEDSDSSLESASSSLSGASPIIQPSSRPALLPTPTFVNQPPVNFPPPINPPVAPLPHLEQAPPTMYPPPIVYPPSQVPFVNTGAPPPVLSHPPTSIPPPTAVIPQPSPLLPHPPNTSIPPVNTALLPNPNTFQLPPNMPPASAVPGSAPFIPNQNSTVPNYPPGPNPFGNQGQPFYFMQQPPTIPNVPQSENMGVQSAPPMSVPPVNPVQMQPTSFPLPSSTSLPPTSSIPIQVPTSLPIQPTTSLAVPTAAIQPTDTVSITTSPVDKEESKPVKLPKLWRSATDSEGNVYYYHSVTRQTQWDPPSMDEAEDESEDEDMDSESEESESSDTPTYDEPKVSNKHVKRKPKKRKTTKAAADTSVSITVRPEVAKKIKELFRTKMSSYIVHCLNAYRKPDCKIGRITSNEDFKYLARKLTHYTMTKELKQCKSVEDLDCNECVMHKAKDFIKKYMSKYGSKYSRKEKYSPPDA
ncbi:histone-lysine N-methyltransferase SETD2-like isoform X2 [Argiope bruennichi]|uniref:histone-lysine N-methyltransferase SETD2-like isoform X2 n=1 Tax=Argiope bruennichi TaxID=94029 RepID=UPI002494EA8A|nr:histone-lysine N-methyltransferase SETD2-like isoform X2 [Argiope bruennichi]